MQTKIASKLIISMLMTGLFSSAQTVTIDYFGQADPGKTLTKFAPGLISNSGVSDLYVTFSPSGKEMFYRQDGTNKYAEYVDGAWQNFKDTVVADPYSSILYTPVEGLVYVWEAPGLPLGYMTKDGDSWSSVNEVDIPGTKGWPSATIDSMIYYMGDNSTVYCSKFNGTSHETPKALPYPVNNNPNFTLCDISVSAKGDYLVFLKCGAWFPNMYVSFKMDEDHWTDPILVSDYYLTSSAVPFFGQRSILSTDGKYLFGADYPQNYDMDLYWVSTSIFEDAKNLNFSPYKRNDIPDQTDTIGNHYSYTIPDSIFYNHNGNENLTLSARLSNGNELPDSLVFYSETNTISGTLNEVGSFDIEVEGTDTEGESVSDIFRLTVAEKPVGLNETFTHEIIVYPNPAYNKIFIKSANFDIINSHYKIISITGTTLQEGYLSINSIDISELKTGTYLLQLKTNAEVITKRIVVE